MEGILSFVSRYKTLERDKQAKNDLSQHQELLQEIHETNAKIEALRSCFDCETNFDMIDVTIMELKALESRYSYLLRKAKEEKLRAF